MEEEVIEGIRDILERLARNESFNRLVREYFRILAQPALRRELKASRAFEGFSDVTWFAHRLGRWRTKGARECLSLLRRIHESVRRFGVVTTMDALMEVMRKTELR